MPFLRSSRSQQLVLFAAVLVGGCTCSNVPTGPAGDVLTASCGFIDRCPEQAQFPIAYRSQAECAEILNFVTTCQVRQVEGPGGERVPVLVKTMLSVDAAQAAACKAFLESAPCDAVLSGCNPATDAGCNPCSRLFTPTSSTGGSDGTPKAGVDEKCQADGDCEEGLYCLSASTTEDGGQICRVCKPLRTAGGNCSDPPYVQCAKGLFCDSSGACTSVLGDGAACTSPSHCVSAFCHPTRRQCDPGGRLGDACTVTADCRAGFCDTNGRCAESKPNGATCTNASECQTGTCDAPTSKCGKPDGAQCSSSFECQGACDTTARRCVPGIADGAACTQSDRCQSRLCHSNKRVCVTPCPSAGDCPAGTFCDSYGSCAAVAMNGASCRRDEECASRFCNSNDVCATRPGIGDACTGAADCFPKGRCAGGTCQALAKPGAACTSLDACAPPFLCKDGTCQLMSLSCEPAAEGQQCAWLQVCDEKTSCDVLKGFTCTAKKPAGDGCLRSVDCQAGLFCSSRSCAPFAQAGQACGSRTVCASGLFCDESVSPQVCSAPKPVGAPCRTDEGCESGACSSSKCVSACLPPPAGELPACHPATCSDWGFTCGTLDAGCGVLTSCGRCTGPQTCGGGGVSNQCGCTPTRACTERECNATFDDGCGRQVSCGMTCDAGTCGGGGTRGVCGCPNDRAAGPSFAAMAISTLTPQMSGGFTPWDAGTLRFIVDGDDAGVYVRIQPPPNTSQASQYLVASGFGFNLPRTASVNGVEVWIRRAGTGALSNTNVTLMQGNVVMGTVAGDPWPSAWSSQRFGGANSLWGSKLTVDQVNSPAFGIGVAASCVGGCELFVDSVQAIVHYGFRCDCSYECRSDSECGSDGCGGTCGQGCGDAGLCTNLYCVPPVFVDQTSGLMWLNETFDRGTCAGLSVAGYGDWRAPTIDELRGRIVGCPATGTGGACPVSTSCARADAGCLTAACDGCAYRQGPNPNQCYLDNHTQWIACTGAGPFFSSTRDGTQNWVVDFATGRVGLSSGAMPRYRCVRP